MSSRTQDNFHRFMSILLLQCDGKLSLAAERACLSLTDLILCTLFLRGADDSVDMVDVREDFPMCWEPTDQHITILRKFYVDSGFLKDRICYLFNLNRSTSATFFRRVLGVTRVQGNAWRSPAKQAVKDSLLSDTRDAYLRIYGIWASRYPDQSREPKRPNIFARALARLAKVVSW